NTLPREETAHGDRWCPRGPSSKRRRTRRASRAQDRRCSLLWLGTATEPLWLANSSQLRLDFDVRLRARHAGIDPSLLALRRIELVLFHRARALLAQHLARAAAPRSARVVDLDAVGLREIEQERIAGS